MTLAHRWFTVGHGLRRWPNSEPTLGQRLMFAMKVQRHNRYTRGCAYTVLQTVQRKGVDSAAYKPSIVHYNGPLKSFKIRVGPNPGFELSSVTILP